MELEWELKNYDWYSIVTDAYYLKQQRIRMNEIVEFVRASTDLVSLRKALTLIPKDISSTIKNEITNRILALSK